MYIHTLNSCKLFEVIFELLFVYQTKDISIDGLAIVLI